MLRVTPSPPSREGFIPLSSCWRGVRGEVFVEGGRHRNRRPQYRNPIIQRLAWSTILIRVHPDRVSPKHLVDFLNSGSKPNTITTCYISIPQFACFLYLGLFQIITEASPPKSLVHQNICRIKSIRFTPHHILQTAIFRRVFHWTTHRKTNHLILITQHESDRPGLIKPRF